MKTYILTGSMLTVLLLSSMATAQDIQFEPTSSFSISDDGPAVDAPHPPAPPMDAEGAEAEYAVPQPQAAHPPTCNCGKKPGDKTCKCGAKKGGKPKKKANPCATSHKGLFYDNDFSYVKDPKTCNSCLGDCLKQLDIGPCGKFGTLDVGGQLRLRYHHERGMGQIANTTRFEPTDNDFLLTRVRLFGNWQVNDWLRFYAEGIYADASAERNYIARPIDRNHGDFLNLFADLRLNDAWSVRVGRQELLYGNQRLVSPLDWANTRRTFEGVKVMYKCDDWKIDGFYTQFVPVDPFEFDESDDDRDFYGLYATYSGYKHFDVDMFYLGFDDNRELGNAPPGSRDFSLHTVGARVNGELDNWLFEAEGGGQFGRESGLGVDHRAGYGTVGLGRKMECVKWKPTLWFYYDYASGNSPGDSFNRFNDLFPLAHKYLGFIDATLRRNISSPNVLLTMNPHKKLRFLFWYYHLRSAQSEDIVPSVGGTPPQSLDSDHWGDELDVIVRYQIVPRSNILFGYSHFWRGDKILAPEDADFFYTQWELNF